MNNALRKADEQRQEENRLSYSFDEAMSINTGLFMPPSKWSENYQRQQLLLLQSIKYADILESYGVKAYTDSNITLISDVTRQETKLTTFSNINFIPKVAQKNRRNHINILEHFFDNNDVKYWRYAVFTFGDRCTLDELEERQEEAKAQLNAYRKEAKRKFGVEFGLVAWEYTIDENATVHFHANILYNPPYFSDKGDGFRSFTYNFMGTWWNDAGRIENLKELLKYPFKPTDLDALSNDQIFQLYNIFKGKRFVEILGPVSIHRRWIEERCYKFFRHKGRLLLRTKSEILQSDKPKEEYDRSAPENIIIGRMLPNFGTCLWSESSTMVLNYNKKTIFEKSKERLVELDKNHFEARQAWDASGAPAPAIALAMTQAAKASAEDDADTNVRALWKRSVLYSTQLDDNWENSDDQKPDHYEFFNETELIEEERQNNVIQLF